MSVSRRGLLAAAGWSVPAITLSSAAPAFAVSKPNVPDHECDIKKCAPKVTCTKTSKKHRKKNPKERYFYRHEKTCGFSEISEEDFFHEDRVEVRTITWLPYRPNDKHKTTFRTVSTVERKKR